MDHNTEKPNVSFGDQRNVLRRRLWDQFVRTLDPYQRQHFYRLIALYPRKRFERALIKLVVALNKADALLAASEPPAKS
jgi:hypothetical protein